MPAPTVLTVLRSVSYVRASLALITLIKGVDIIDHKITLDIHENSPQPGISIPQGDSSRTLLITLTNRGKIYIPGDNMRAVFTALKPDGTVIFNDCEINGSLISYAVTAQTTAVSGALQCQLRLYGYDDELLISPRFVLIVSEAVYKEGDIIDSHDEVSTLTNLVSSTNELTDSLRQSLADGDFIPKLSVGTVSTLPAGQMASVEITGTGEAPVLNFAIPQGEVGTNEQQLPDAALSESSTRPVQNRVITAALNKKADAAAMEQALGLKADTASVNSALALKAENSAVDSALQGKVDKVSGKGLSSNDYTDAEKAKLSGIAENANNYSLPALGVGTNHLAGSAVTAAKIAANAVSSSLTVTLPAAGWVDNTQTVTASGVTAANTLIVTPAPESFTAYAEAQVRCTAQAANSLSFRCEDAPDAELTVNVTCINK